MKLKKGKPKSIFSPTLRALINKQKRVSWWEFSGPDADTFVSYGKGLSWNVKHTMCGLCGQTGIIDTRGQLYTAAGLECGVLRFCICPNGRVMKRRSHLEIPTEDMARRARRQHKGISS